MNAVAEMRACEEGLLHTDFRGSRPVLEKFLADDFVEVSPGGLVSTRQVVVDWLLHKDPDARWQLRDLSVLELTQDLRLVRYHAQQVVPVPSAGKGALHCSLWHYNELLRCWQLRFHQATKLASQ
jgi:hypothetical protein